MKTWYVYTIGFYSVAKYKTMKLAGKSMVRERQKDTFSFANSDHSMVCVCGGVFGYKGE